MTAKLNIFQKTMLQWNELHPYNDVHVATVPAPLDVARLTGIVDSVLEGYGLTGLIIDRDKGTYHYGGGAARTQLNIIPGNPDPRTSLSSEIERQLNTSFPKGPEINPFRFFVVTEGSSFYFGLVYFHFICGAENIVYLVKEIADIYMDKKRDVSSPLLLYPEGYSRLLRARPDYFVKWLLSLPSLISSVRRSFRPSYKDPSDHAMGFAFFSIKRERFKVLLRASKAWGVTVNDLFLAVLLKSLSPLLHERFEEIRRKNISVASIVNIRNDLGIKGRKTFGLFLGSFFVSHIVPPGIALEQLAVDVNHQTARIKKDKLYLGLIMELGLAGIIRPFFSGHRRKTFYQKNYPLAGGITNMNLDSMRKGDGEGARVDYLRAVCTGPVSPLVLALTTVNDILNVGVTFKSTVYSKTDVQTIIREFTNSISEIEEFL